MAEPTPIRGRRSLFPIGIEPIQRYRSTGAVAADLARCAERGWTIIDLDAVSWADRDRLHDTLAGTLGFPDHYGRNLDALADALRDLAEGRLAIGPREPGAALVVRRLDSFLLADPRTGAAVISLFADAAAWALRYGLALSFLIQTDDPSLPLPERPAAAIPWNRAERPQR